MIFMIVCVKIFLREDLPQLSIKEAVHIHEKELKLKKKKKKNPTKFEEKKAIEPEREYKKSTRPFYLGLILTFVGILLFNYGLYYGLAKMGDQIGSILPGVFTKVDVVSDSPRFSYSFGMTLLVAFSFIVGYVATQAEPALHVIGKQVEKMGMMSKKALVTSVSLGVAAGVALGVFKIVYSIPLVWFVVFGYVLALVLNFFVDEFLVNIAWDAAGVTTGPITCPFVLALGVALGKSVGNPDGFGLLTLASLGPILTVLLTGIFINFKKKFFPSKDDDSSYSFSEYDIPEIDVKLKSGDVPL